MHPFKISLIGASALFAATSFSASAFAGTAPVTGWLWSSTAGWISMSSLNPEISSSGGSSYGVSVSTTTGSSIGTLSGYAWSPNAGWISFNSADTLGCPTSDTYDSSNALNGCTPSIDLSSGKVTGWARALAGIPGTSGNTIVNAAYSWNAQAGSGIRNWSKIVSSADGTHLMAFVSSADQTPYYSGDIYTSADSGVTWVDRTAAGTRNWSSKASSADGTHLMAAEYGGYIYTSTDSGATWTARTAAGARNWAATGPGYSTDGSHLAVAATGGYIYTSSDYGATWTARTGAGSRSWSNLTMSSDGTKLAATDGAAGGYIYTSTDSGATWTTRTSAGARSWGNITSSADGTKLAAYAQSDYIYTSTDSGATWTARTSLGKLAWNKLVSSADGTRLAITVSPGDVYVSLDSGVTWVAQSVGGSLTWSNINMSADGTKLAATVKGGYIYTYGPSSSVNSTASAAWDGWIHLSGTNHSSPDASGANGTSNLGVTYSPSTNGLSGFAWDGSLQSLIGLATSTGAAALNAQDGFYYQFITATNNTNGVLPGLRATLVTPLAASTTLYDYAGTDSAEYKYLQYNYPVQPGQTVVLHAQFYSPLRNMSSAATPSYIVSAIATPLSEPSVPSGATAVTISKTAGLTLAGFPTGYYVEFPATIGAAYGVQYSDDNGNTWHVMYGQGSSAKVVVAANTVVDYVDYGPSVAYSMPSSGRLYRVWKLASGTYPDRSVANAGIYLPGVNPIDLGFIGWLDFYSVGIGTTTANTASTFSVSGSSISLNNAAGTVSGTAQVTVSGTGLASQTINISANTSGLPSGVSVTAGPTPSSCVVSGGSAVCNVSFTVQALNTVPDGTVGSFTVTGTRASDSAVQTGTVIVTVSGNTAANASNGVNLWAGSATATSSYSYVTLPNKIVPLYWTAKNYGYCVPSTPSYPTGATGLSGWTSMATTTTVSTLGTASVLNVNSSLSLLSSNPIKPNLTGTYTFKLSCLPVDSSGKKTSSTYVDSPLVTVRVTSSSVTEF